MDGASFSRRRTDAWTTRRGGQADRRTATTSNQPPAWALARMYVVCSMHVCMYVCRDELETSTTHYVCRDEVETSTTHHASISIYLPSKQDGAP